MTPVLDPGLEGFAAVAFAFAVAIAIAGRAASKNILALPESQDRLGCIDGIRGYLALAVLMHHFFLWLRFASGKPWAAPPSHVFNNLGQAAVLVFFMITGALFYRRILASTTRPIDWPTLYVSRVFRLVPIYWVAVAVVVLLACLRTEVQTQTPSEFASSVATWLTFTGMPSIAGYGRTGQIVAGVFWTLQYEWVFYLLLPALALAVTAARSAALPTLFVPIILLALFASGIVPSNLKVAIGMSFVFGMVAVEIADRTAIRRWLQSAPAAALGVTALLIALVTFPHSFAFLPIVLLALFFAPVVSGNSYFGALKAPGSIALGEISYSIYLLHGIIMSVFMMEGLTALGWPVSPALWIALPVLTAITVTLSIATYRTIEKPAIDFGKRINLRRRFTNDHKETVG